MSLQEEIVVFIRKAYSPIAIVLHGSRTKNAPASDADWDLVVVTEKEEKGGPILFKGEHIDLDFVHPNEEVLINSHGYPLAHATLLMDTDDIGQNLIKRTHEARKKGRVLSAEEKENRKKRLERTISRLKRWEGNHLVSFGYEALFYQLVMRYWFEVRGRFPENVRESIETFEREDEAFLDILREFIEEKRKWKAAEEMWRILFGRSEVIL